MILMNPLHGDISNIEIFPFHCVLLECIIPFSAKFLLKKLPFFAHFASTTLPFLINGISVICILSLFSNEQTRFTETVLTRVGSLAF